MQCSQEDVGESGATGHCWRPCTTLLFCVHHCHYQGNTVDQGHQDHHHGHTLDSLHQAHLRSQRNAGVVEEAIVFKRKVARSVCLKCAAGGGVNILQISTCPPARNMSHGGSHHFHEDNLKFAPTSTWWPRLRVFGNQPL